MGGEMKGDLVQEEGGTKGAPFVHLSSTPLVLSVHPGHADDPLNPNVCLGSKKATVVQKCHILSWTGVFVVSTGRQLSPPTPSRPFDRHLYPLAVFPKRLRQFQTFSQPMLSPAVVLPAVALALAASAHPLAAAPPSKAQSSFQLPLKPNLSPHDIQGPGWLSAYDGQRVHGLRGLVTAKSCVFSCLVAHLGWS